MGFLCCRQYSRTLHTQKGFMPASTANGIKCESVHIFMWGDAKERVDEMRKFCKNIVIPWVEIPFSFLWSVLLRQVKLKTPWLLSTMFGGTFWESTKRLEKKVALFHLFDNGYLTYWDWYDFHFFRKIATFFIRLLFWLKLLILWLL